MKKALLLILAVSLVFSCGGRRASKQVDAAADSAAVAEAVVEAPVADAALTECACLMAGMSVPEDSPRASIMAKDSWKSHHAALDALWNQCRKSLDEVDALRRSDLADIDARAKTVFYTFGGPDFSYVAAFFPSADTLYLFGLEPAGKAITDKDLTAAAPTCAGATSSRSR